MKFPGPTRRRRRGLIVAIGDLLSGELGFDNHNPQTGGPNRKDALGTPRQRVSSIRSPRKRVLVIMRARRLTDARSTNWRASAVRRVDIS